MGLVEAWKNRTHKTLIFKAFAQDCNCEFDIKMSGRPEGVVTAEGRQLAQGSVELVRALPFGFWREYPHIIEGNNVDQKLADKMIGQVLMRVRLGIYER